jgi:DNA-binding response OmpR family regulator
MAIESILVVDDEQDILELVRYNLAREGFTVTCVKTGEDAARSIKSRQPALIILDLMLPGVNGLEFCRRLRSDPETASIPVIMLTAKTEDIDIVTGLEIGADDYITKPFSPRVLIARVRAIIRRDKPKELEMIKTIHVNNLVVHPGRREVKAGDRIIDLTFTEFGILYLLASRPGWVFSRQDITEIVKGGPNEVMDRAVDVHVAGLRKKLGSFGELIETVRGVGYKFREQD